MTQLTIPFARELLKSGAWVAPADLLLHRQQALVAIKPLNYRMLSTEIHFNIQNHTHFISFFNNNGTLESPENTVGNIYIYIYISLHTLKLKNIYTPTYMYIICVGFNFCFDLDYASWMVG